MVDNIGHLPKSRLFDCLPAAPPEIAAVMTRTLLRIVLASAWCFTAWTTASAAELKPSTKSPAALPPDEALLKAEAWQQSPFERVTSAEIDRLIVAEQKAMATKSGAKQAPFAARTTDEEFVRRLTIDVCGRLPTPAEIEAFVADADPEKRAALIDRLLESDDFSAHWARYWSDVFGYRVSPIMRRNQPIFEEWLFEQFQSRKSWADITRGMLASDAVLSDVAKWPKDANRFPQVERDGATFFIAVHYYEKTRAEAAVDLAAETSRVFLGLQLQCAECHDHPSDQWKRVQFHQLAAYFARSGGRPRPIGKGSVNSFTQVYYPDGEYDMPDEHDPTKAYVVQPAFLDGVGPGAEQSDQERRQALAEKIVDKRNFWFAAAFVNRMWGELMGQAFYQPIDDLGPMKSNVFPTVLSRLAGAFRGTDYEIRDLFRTMLNTECYQRQFRLGESPDEHLAFKAAYPSRMLPGALWNALDAVLKIPAPAAPAKVETAQAGAPAAEERTFKKPEGTEAEFLEQFDYDPSLEPEPSLTQALLLMNGYAVNVRIPATKPNLLFRVLAEQPDDAAALRQVYLKALARCPTVREEAICREHIAKAGAGKRAAAYEDIFWSIINGPEFQLKR